MKAHVEDRFTAEAPAPVPLVGRGISMGVWMLPGKTGDSEASGPWLWHRSRETTVTAANVREGHP
ncbi:hypothetical protein I6F07_22800 [Ensifer sp. IC4062]|nr:hypothetical protein [Ensifer sp. IC4062]MCA1443002.1 hypothetical protein [Ensifer sp. IC4062]